MPKITFIGAGSTVFAKNIIGDLLMTESASESEIALYDIDQKKLTESFNLLETINKKVNSGKAKIKTYMGEIERKEALKGSAFVITAIQVGGYEPSTVIDFDIPKKYGVRQTIADTLGIGGIFRGLRTLPVFESIAKDMLEVCPNALMLNYVNPMAIITGFMTRYTGVKTVGLCHSVQVCSKDLLTNLGMSDKIDGAVDYIAGINHMAWLLEIRDKNGNDLYPEIKKRALEKNAKEKHNDMVRFEYIKRLGYYCTESSEHNAEYNPFFIKSKYPELIEKYNIPLDEYPSRCVNQNIIWDEVSKFLSTGQKMDIEKYKDNALLMKEMKKYSEGDFANHRKTMEYGSYIIDSIVTNKPYKIGGNVLNNGLIENIDKNACVEVPCLVDGNGINPCRVGMLPLHLAAMNMSNVNVQLLAIEAHVSKKRDAVYHAAMLDPHTASELSIDDIVSMCDDLIEAHGNMLPKYN